MAQLKKSEDAFPRAYPGLMDGRLAGKRVAVLFVGSIDSGINQAIADTLHDAGAAPPTRVLSVSVPVNAQNVDSVLFDKGAKFVKYVGNDKLENLGNALGTEFAAGGATPLWKTLGRELISERTGNARQPIDGVVVVRTAKPQQGDTMRFLRGLYSGLASAGVPAVGVESTNTKLSAAKVFRARGLSAVDDMDEMTGRAALALLLAGAPSRHLRHRRTTPTGSCRRPRVARPPAAVLVAARDEEERIAETVAALRQAFPDAKVIVADDGSRDAHRRARGGRRRNRAAAAAPRQGAGALRRRARRAAGAGAARGRRRPRRPARRLSTDDGLSVSRRSPSARAAASGSRSVRRVR